ncbi:MAG: hypothetical protein ACTS3T_20675 [Almyronema sp.]
MSSAVVSAYWLYDWLTDLDASLSTAIQFLSVAPPVKSDRCSPPR